MNSQQEVVFQGTRYSEGSTLVVLQEGLGYERNTPDFAQFMGFAQSALSVADPGVWGSQLWNHWTSPMIRMQGVHVY